MSFHFTADERRQENQQQRLPLGDFGVKIPQNDSKTQSLSILNLFLRHSSRTKLTVSHQVLYCPGVQPWRVNHKRKS